MTPIFFNDGDPVILPACPGDIVERRLTMGVMPGMLVGLRIEAPSSHREIRRFALCMYISPRGLSLLSPNLLVGTAQIDDLWVPELTLGTDPGLRIHPSVETHLLVLDIRTVNAPVETSGRYAAIFA